MPTYEVSFKDTTSVSEGTTSSGDKTVDVATVTEGFEGQTQLTSQVATVVETFGVPIVTFADAATVTEVHRLLQQQAEAADYVQYTETFDISGSLLHNPEKHDDVALVTEIIVIQANYNVPGRDEVAVNETHRISKRFDYQTEDQYYYRPRRP